MILKYQYKKALCGKTIEITHISVNVHNGDETGSISIRNGELLADNLSQRSVNWCVNELLTEENKLRINIMIDSRNFYRLDREFEIKGHPFPKDIITAMKNPTWDDKLILEVTYINNYEYIIQFKDKKFKIVDILPYISKYPEIYTPLMKDKTLLKKFQYDLIEMYWDDIMGIEAQTLYDMGKNMD